MRFVNAFLPMGLALGFAAACGSSEESTFPGGDGPDSGIGNDGSSGNDEDGGGIIGNGGNGDAAVQTLRVEPSTITVTVSGTIAAPVGAAQFKAYLSGAPTTATAATWYIDNASLGTVDAAGAFSASATAGKTKLYARVGNLTASADVVVNVKLEENFANLNSADKSALRAGGAVDTANFKWLYPYDKTVFPRGLPSPRLQFAGAAPKAYYVHVKSGQYEYEGFYAGGTGAARVTVAEAWWKSVTQSAGASDPVKVSVTKIDSAGGVTGPIDETWVIAAASLKGTVLYNSYNSKLASNTVQSSGAIMRVKIGQPVEVLLGSASVGGSERKCVVCHSASANGTRLVTGIDWGDGDNPYFSGTFNIGTTGAPTMRYSDEEGRKLPFGAVSADGTWLLGSGISPNGPNLRGLTGKFRSRLYNGSTGVVVDDAYFGGATERFALTPAFSPDGKFVAFNDGSVAGGHTLGLLAFDGAASPPTFGGYAALATNANKVLGWPTFTSDSKAVLYHEGDHFDTAAHSSTPTLGAKYADLKWVDLATKTAGNLNALNGFEPNPAGGVRCYLPYGEAQEGHLNYEPTLLPVPAGGYYWVVFTSRRALGNTIYDGPNSLRAVGDKAFDNGDAIGRGFRKKLWVAAIDINGTAGADISHPAFYLEGQEAEAGNMRGFWTLDPCKSDGNNCESGDECCGGFCRGVPGPNNTIVKQCVAPPTGCSNDSEKCSVDADCCTVSSGARCLNGFCATSTPPR